MEFKVDDVTDNNFVANAINIYFANIVKEIAQHIIPIFSYE